MEFKSREEVLYDLILAFASNPNIDPDDVVTTAQKVSDDYFSLRSTDNSHLDIPGLKEGISQH